tara:strand:+ start:457 stop:699 length:243 start_codon:yes stop_codon:yes gene_type:complete
MSAIQPWTYPLSPEFDRVTYLPGKKLHALEYQVEMIDSEGNSYWKTEDTSTVVPETSVKEFLEQMKDCYEEHSCTKSAMS